MKNVLVAGGCGYIGSHVVRELYNSGDYDQIIVLDNLSTGHVESLAGYDTRVIYHKADLTNIGLLDDIITDYEIDAVINLAANSLVGESNINPSKYYRNNLIGSINLLDLMVKHGIKKLIFSSTAAVYGFTTEPLLTEESLVYPINVYGNTKLAIEKMIQDYAKAYDIKYTIFRYFNAAGAHYHPWNTGKDDLPLIGEDHNPETHLIPSILKSALKGEPVTIYGNDYPTHDGTCVRDYVHVNDIANAHLLAIDYLDDHDSDIFNLGSSQGYSILEILDAVNATMTSSLGVSFQYGARRVGDPPLLVANADKAKELLKWDPIHSTILEMIGSSMVWHSAKSNGYATVDQVLDTL